MTLTILLDLDDTLLENDINDFIREYFGLLGNALSQYVDPPKMLKAMRSAVQAMLTKQLPSATLEETFDLVFYPEIGIPKSEVAQTISHFYKDVFPQLHTLTKPRPKAVDLINALFSQGASIVIATNPLFPHTAIRQRLEWAGFSSVIDQFALITDYEGFHYCKPHPAYYAEILSRLRWPTGPVVMVGNSLQDDILPAEKMGIPTFWLSKEERPAGDYHLHSRSGLLEDVLSWVEELNTLNILPSFDSTQAIVATLQATPAVLDTISRKIPPNIWNRRPAPNEWNFVELVCHLRDVDREVNSLRIESVLSGANPFIPGIDTDSWADERNYAAENGPTALQEFIQARTDILTRLLELSPEAWQQPARHAIFGPTTLKELVGFTATHDRVHVTQSWQAIA